MNANVLKWLFFGVLLALVPLGSGWILKLIVGSNSSLEALISQGELLLITAGLCAAGVGSLIGSGSNLARAKIVSAGSSIIILLLSALVFSFISNPGALSVQPDTEVIMVASILIYICAFFSSGACAYLSE